MSVSSLVETPFLQDLLPPSIQSQRAGPIPSEISTVTIDDTEEKSELVILPAELDAEVSPNSTTITTVAPTTATTSTIAVTLDSNKMKYPSELISIDHVCVVGHVEMRTP